jgi:hypothetical protein
MRVPKLYLFTLYSSLEADTEPYRRTVLLGYMIVRSGRNERGDCAPGGRALDGCGASGGVGRASAWIQSEKSGHCTMHIGGAGVVHSSIDVMWHLGLGLALGTWVPGREQFRGVPKQVCDWHHIGVVVTLGTDYYVMLCDQHTRPQGRVSFYILGPKRSKVWR